MPEHLLIYKNNRIEIKIIIVLRLRKQRENILSFYLIVFVVISFLVSIHSFDCDCLFCLFQSLIITTNKVSTKYYITIGIFEVL